MIIVVWCYIREGVLIINFIKFYRYVENGEWIFFGVKLKCNVLIYDCCEGMYLDVMYYFEFCRCILFYIMNFILFCVLIVVLIFFVFLLLLEFGERMFFGVIVLLFFIIFLLMLMVGIMSWIRYCFFLCCIWLFF